MPTVLYIQQRSIITAAVNHWWWRKCWKTTEDTRIHHCNTEKLKLRLCITHKLPDVATIRRLFAFQNSCNGTSQRRLPTIGTSSANDRAFKNLQIIRQFYLLNKIRTTSRRHSGKSVSSELLQEFLVWYWRSDSSRTSQLTPHVCSLCYNLNLSYYPAFCKEHLACPFTTVDNLDEALSTKHFFPRDPITLSDDDWVYNHLLRKVFRFRYLSQKVIGSYGPMGFQLFRNPNATHGTGIFTYMNAINFWAIHVGKSYHSHGANGKNMWQLLHHIF